NLRAGPEQSLLDADRHFTGERKRLLAFGEDADVPVMLVFCRSQLRACILIGCRPLLELPQLRVLSFDLRRSRLLPPLEVLDAVHHRGAVCVDGAEQTRAPEAKVLVPLVLGLRCAVLSDTS